MVAFPNISSAPISHSCVLCRWAMLCTSKAATPSTTICQCRGKRGDHYTCLELHFVYRLNSAVGSLSNDNSNNKTIICSITQVIESSSLAHSLTHSLTLSLTHLLIQSVTHTHTNTHTLAHLRTGVALSQRPIHGCARESVSLLGANGVSE